MNENIVQYSSKVYELCDISKATNTNFRHAHFQYVSGKGAFFREVDFSYAVMTDCYFHNAKFFNCNFTGARMYRCNFRGAEFELCDFRYIDANETRISTSQVLNNMPDYPNIGREVAQVMRRNATSLGDAEASRRFVLYELDQRKEHIRRALRGEGNYYKTKYGSFKSKLLLRLSRAFLMLDSLVWGHGEKVWRLVLSSFILVALASLVPTYQWWGQNAGSAIGALWGEYKVAFVHYLNFFLSIENSAKFPRYWGVELTLAIARIVFLGMLISVLFRWLSHR